MEYNPKRLDNDGFNYEIMTVQDRFDRDLGEMAESLLRLWAAQVNITANRANIDREGWDFFLQFPYESVEPDTTLDRREARIECLVQVKATTKSQDRKSIKLSNWGKLVESPFPAFFLVVVCSDGFEPESAYLVHLDESYITNVLRRLRELGGEDENTLHRRTMDLRWNNSDMLSTSDGLGLKQAVQNYVIDGMESYFDWKRGVRSDAGDPVPNLLRWSKTFDSNDQSWLELVGFAIGVKDSISVPEMVLEEDVRFNTPRKETSLGEGILEITSRSSIECLLDFHDPEFSAQAIFPAELFNTRMVLGDLDVPSKFNRWRITFELGELIVEVESGKGMLTMSLPALEKEYSFESLLNAWKLVDVFAKSNVIQVSITAFSDTTKHRIEAQLSIDDNEIDINELLEYCEIVDKTRRMLHALDLSLDFQTSVIQLLNHQSTTDNILSVVDPREEIQPITVLHDNVDVDAILEAELVIPFFIMLNHDEQHVLLKIAVAGFPELTGITAPGQKEFRLARTRVLRFEQQAFLSDSELELDSSMAEFQDSFDSEGYNVLLLSRSPQNE